MKPVDPNQKKQFNIKQIPPAIVPPSSRHARRDSRLQIFLGFFLVSCVLGLGFRIYFSPARVTKLVSGFIAQQMKSPSGQPLVTFKSAEVSLADGVIPEMALNIRDLEIAPVDPCTKGRYLPSIRISSAHFPLDLIKLANREIAFAQIRADKLEVHAATFANHCESVAVVEPTAQVPAVSPDASAIVAVSPTPPSPAIQEPMATKSPKTFWDAEKLEPILKVVRGVNFEEVKIYFDRDDQFVSLKDFELGPGNLAGGLKLKTTVVIPPHVTQGVELPPFELRGDLTPGHILASLDGHLAEGLVRAKADLEPGAHGPKLQLDLQAKQIPLASFANYLVKAHLMPEHTQPKFLWLGFEAAISADLVSIKQAPWDFHNISLEGNFGKAKIAELKRLPDGNFSEFVLEFEKLNFAKSFELLGVKGPDGVFSQFGEFAGKLRYFSAQHFALDGDWHDATMRFSRGGRRVEQKIDHLNLGLEMKDSGFNGKLSGIQLAQGRFEGDVTFHFDSAFSNGELFIHAPDIELSPEVQKTMFAGEAAGVRLKGELGIQKLVVKTWKGEVEINSLKSESLNFEKAQFTSQFDGEHLKIESQISEGLYQNNKHLGDWMRKCLLGFTQDTDAVDFKNLHGQVFLSGKDWSWKNLNMKVLGGKVALSSSGEMTSVDRVTGELDFDFPKVKKIQWQLRGSSEEPEFLPVSANLKQLLAKKADYTSLGLNQAAAAPAAPSKGL